jgi:hypothetical protein
VEAVEHDAEWYRRLLESGVTDIRLVPPASTGSIRSNKSTGYFDQYVSTILEYPDLTFDLVIVDGRCRVASIVNAAKKVRRGGWIYLDDSDRGEYSSVRDVLPGWTERAFTDLKAGGGPPVRGSFFLKP